MTTAIVVVSHSAQLADGVCELAAQMAPDVRLVAAGGTDDGRLGTSFELVAQAVRQAVAEAGGVVVLTDLGSATMTAEAVLEMLDDDRVVAADGPLVEGAVAAAVAAQGGANVGAVRSAAELGVWMVNVHASGGRRMMEACREILDRRSGHRPLLTAVTVLTSLEQEDLQEMGIDIEPMVQVQRLARLTQDCGLDGVVCSAREAKALRNALNEDFKLVTPGIRPDDASADDQKRIVTPRQAIDNGSSYLVIGRPITRAEDPGAAVASILESLTS